MSNFRSMIAHDALQWVLDADGDGVDAIIYTPAGGLARQIQARIRYQPELESTNTDAGERLYRLATILISTDPTLGVADPGEGDLVEIGGEAWNVVGVEARIQGQLTRVNLRRTERTQLNAGPGYRRAQGAR